MPALIVRCCYCQLYCTFCESFRHFGFDGVSQPTDVYQVSITKKQALEEESPGGLWAPFHTDCECMVQEMTYHKAGPHASAPFRRITLKVMNEAPEIQPALKESKGYVATKTASRGGIRAQPAELSCAHPLFGTSEL